MVEGDERGFEKRNEGRYIGNKGKVVKRIQKADRRNEREGGGVGVKDGREGEDMMK